MKQQSTKEAYSKRARKSEFRKTRTFFPALAKNKSVDKRNKNGTNGFFIIKPNSSTNQKITRICAYEKL